MFTPPLFEPNILATLIRNFSFYINDGYWGYVFSGIMLIIFSQFLWIKPRREEIAFPSASFSFDKHNPKDIAALFLLFFCFSAVTVLLYSLEMSLFANFDLMNIGTTINFFEGKGTGISDIRFAPFANIELNLFYAITQNYYIITALVLSETVFILYLLYRLFDFIPPAKRLCSLSMIMLLPAFLWINNCSFPERLMLIFICSSLLFLKKYFVAPNFKSLFLFTLLMNLALYTKESVILFYAGILAVNILWLIYKGRIVMTSFIHPFRTAREMPVEYMMFFSMLIFALIYLLLGVGMSENEYVRNHLFHEGWKSYYLEIFILITAAAGIAFGKVFNRTLLGILAGSTLILLVIAWGLGITSGVGTTHYAVIPGVFGIFIIAYSVNKRSLLIVLSTLFLICACYGNLKLYENQNGKYYMEVAVFLEKEKFNTEKTSIFVTDSLNGGYKAYIVDCYRSAYKYYFPQKNIIFKTNAAIDEDHPFLKFPIIYQSAPKKGDIYIENKFHSQSHPKNYLQIYENKIFRVFQIN